MALATGPLLSFGASGKLGGTVVFSSWKGRPYVRQLVKPSNPKSATQKSVRALMKFLAQNWAAIAGADQATWDDLATSQAISAFNAYVQNNARRWTQFEPPTQAYPAAEAGTVDTITPTPTGGVGQIALAISSASSNDNWGVFVFLSTSTGFATARDNMVLAIFTGPGAFSVTGTITGLDPGTYYLNYRCFTNDGVLGAEVGEDTVVVT